MQKVLRKGFQSGAKGQGTNVLIKVITYLYPVAIGETKHANFDIDN